MKSPGLGSVTQRGPDRWWARGPRPARTSLGVYATEEEAEDVRRAAVAELARADRTRAPGVSLRAFGARYLDEREREAPRSIKAERSRWKHVLLAPWADDPIDMLTTPAVDRWARKLARTLPGSTGYVLVLLSQVCAAAVREGLAKTNPCREVRVRRAPRTHEPWTYLLPDEQRALLTAPIPVADALVIAVAMFTGLRQGELFSLRLADVHLDGDRPHVVVRYGSASAATKGKRIRHVPLFPPALAALRRWLEILPTWAPSNPRRLAFPGPHGGHRGPSRHLHHNVYRDGRNVRVDGFAAALRAAGIVAADRHDGRPVRWHDLRHTFGASLAAGWWGTPWRIEEIREVLGHASITTTQRYAHLSLDVLPVGGTTGLRPGDGPRSPLALPAANAAPIEAAEEGEPQKPYFRAIANGSETLPHASPGHHPRALAIDGLRALARGDEEAARAAALRLACGGEPTSARLCELFEAALDGERGARGVG